MAYGESDSGISAAKEGAASKQLGPTSEFLTGPQSSSVIGSLTGLRESAARKTAAAGARPDQIRAAAREANALQLAQVARQASIAKQGIATGGGVGRAGGSTALDLMRQASAASVTAEERAGQAAVEAAEAEKEESQLGTDLAMFEAEMVASQQKQIGAFVEDVALSIDSMKGAGQQNDEIGAVVAAKIGSMDTNDPAQKAAAVNALRHWAGYNGQSPTTFDVASLILDFWGADAAAIMGGSPWLWNGSINVIQKIREFEEEHGLDAEPEQGWEEYLKGVGGYHTLTGGNFGADVLDLVEAWRTPKSPSFDITPVV